MKYKYRVSVIVPIYNAEEYLRDCLDSLVSQTVAQEKMQVLLIDDGSTDESADICMEYCALHSNFAYKRIENSGVSAARNCGLKMAEGKYIMYLDSDDKLTPVSVKSLADFFDKVYDAVDAVTYFMQPFKNNELLNPPARYRKVLTYQGVFDLEENPYVTQTTMNICVKNKFADNVLFNEKMTCHEDQEYINRVVMEKLRIGYCLAACYMYNRGNENSCLATKFHAYYLFEQTMAYFENLFAMFEDKVPKYFQAMFFHDLRWKLTDRILYPFHYEKEEFKAAMKRIKKLLARVDTDIIVNNPSIQKSHIHYWLNLKPNVYPMPYIDREAADVVAEGRTIERNKRVFIRLLRITQLEGGRFRIRCDFPMGIFNFMKKAPAVYAIENGERKQRMKLYRSTNSYVDTDIMTNKVYGFVYTFDPAEVNRLSFKAVIDSYSFDVKINFAPLAVFRHKDRFYSFAVGSYSVSFFNDSLIFEKKTDDELRSLELFNAKKFSCNTCSYELKCTAIEKRAKSRIWLYSDAADTVKGNAYYQFLNDFAHDDGIERFYVYTGSLDSTSSLFSEEQREHLVKFGSYEHRVLYLSAQTVFTSAWEREKFSPFFSESEEMNYIDIEHFKTVYLQSNILNFTCPDRFSAERTLCDKIVVSSPFEVKNLTGKYRFKEDELIKTGMPRFDFLDRNLKAGDRVLFVPCWRSYFSINGDTEKTSIKSLENSEYYKGIKAFLSDERLHEALEKSGVVLDFKPSCGGEFFRDLLEKCSDRINLAKEDIKPEEYKLLITDFSGLAFDFVLISRPVLYFVPDYPQFKSGMGRYRELDLPFEKAFGPFVQDADAAVAEFLKLAENGYKPAPVYAERISSFYFTNKNCSEEIYNYVFGTLV